MHRRAGISGRQRFLSKPPSLPSQKQLPNRGHYSKASCLATSHTPAHAHVARGSHRQQQQAVHRVAHVWTCLSARSRLQVPVVAWACTGLLLDKSTSTRRRRPHLRRASCRRGRYGPWPTRASSALAETWLGCPTPPPARRGSLSGHLCYEQTVGKKSRGVSAVVTLKAKRRLRHEGYAS